MMKSIDLIDGDIIVYILAYNTTKAIDDGSITFGGRATSAEAKREAALEAAYKRTDTYMKELWQLSGATHYHGYLSGSRRTNYRSEWSSTEEYKGNRSTEKPKFFKEISNYLQDRWGFVQLDIIEADDMLGVMQVRYNGIEDCRSKIISKDKDLKQIPGINYNLETGDLIDVRDYDAHRLLWMQMLTGDSVDNIMGCGERVDRVYQSGAKEGQTYRSRVGVGPQKAEKILDSVKPSQYYAVVLREYITTYGHLKGIRKFNETFNQVYILRKPGELEEVGFEITAEVLAENSWTDNINKLPEETEEEEEF